MAEVGTDGLLSDGHYREPGNPEADDARDHVPRDAGLQSLTAAPSPTPPASRAVALATPLRWQGCVVFIQGGTAL